MAFEDLYWRDIRIRKSDNIDGYLHYLSEIEVEGTTYVFSSRDDDPDAFIKSSEKDLLEIYDKLNIHPDQRELLIAGIEKMKKLRLSDLKNIEDGKDWDDEMISFTNNLFSIFLDGIEVGLANAIHSKLLHRHTGEWFVVPVGDTISNEDLSHVPEDTDRTLRVRSTKCISMSWRTNNSGGEDNE